MNSEINQHWYTLLEQTGAVFDDAGVVHFGDPECELRAALAGDIVCDLSHYSVLAVNGTDAKTFLQGQFTNDIRLVTPGHSQLSSWCNAKGRMLACFRVFQRDDVYYLRLPAERSETVLKRLRLYVLRAHVELVDRSAEMARFGMAGAQAESQLQAMLGSAPTAIDDAITHNGITAIRVPGSQARFELYGEPARLAPLWKQLSEHAGPAGAEAWRLLNIVAGVPEVYDSTSEAFVPQMTNLELINGVSFTKGCYTGQEIVARTHYLGKLKRRMYRAHVDADTPPQAGDDLFLGGLFSGNDEQSIGKIVDACRFPDGGYEVLAVVLSDSLAGRSIRLRHPEGAALDIRTLPYRIDPVPA